MTRRSMRLLGIFALLICGCTPAPQFEIATYNPGDAIFIGKHGGDGVIRLQGRCVVMEVPGQGTVLPVFAQSLYKVEGDQLVFRRGDQPPRYVKMGDTLEDNSPTPPLNPTIPAGCPRDLPLWIAGRPLK